MSYKLEQDYKYKAKDMWDWSVWVEASNDDLDEIEYVEYTLHPTFINPVREVYDRATKFKLSTTGWGVFTIYAIAYLKDKNEVKLEHELILRYEDGKRTFK
jgi:transcription initiation factor IIF auxiliary subunit